MIEIGCYSHERVCQQGGVSPSLQWEKRRKVLREGERVAREGGREGEWEG